MVNISFMFFLEKVMHLDLVALTVIFQFVQNPLTVFTKFCNPTGVQAIRITSSSKKYKYRLEVLGVVNLNRQG